jgi:FMN phosphatase YigB (HAD superfamily)
MNIPFTTILLDLDDTLLKVDMSAFVPAYVSGLASVLADFAPPEQISTWIIEATKAIGHNHDSQVTNAQAFYATFLPHFQAPAADIYAAVDQFWHTGYPLLARYVTPQTAAQPLVQALFEQGYQVVIATNPLYPRQAIEQRLTWAGVDQFPYQLITCLENMPYAKPDLAYYQTILDNIQGHPQTTLMIGDDLKNDIAPAQSLGCKTWWITDEAEANITSPADYQGTLTACYRWFQGQRSP